MKQKEGEKTDKQKSDHKEKFIKWFSDLNKNSGPVAGGKGANLGEMIKIKMPVPPGFVVTAQAYSYFIEKSGLNEEINQLLDSINIDDTAQLNKKAKQIRGLIENSKLPKEMEEEISEAYENLDINKEIMENAEGTALDILKRSSEPIFVAVRSSATTEDLETASFAGQQSTFLNIKGKITLLEAVKKCFASLFTARAIYYREKKGFEHKKSFLAVIVQRMINSDKSGVIFSKNPIDLSKDDVIMEAVYGLGEGIVSGKIKPDHYTVSRELEIINKKITDKKIAIIRTSAGETKEQKLTSEKSKSQVLEDYEIKRLADYALKLEEHYKKPQDIEFSIEGEKIYILQTRPVTTLEMKKEKKEIEGEEILSGLAASPGIANGKVKIIHDLEDLNKIQKGNVLVTKMTNPDMVVTMQKSAAIVTDEGGITSHAAIVSREMGIPAVVGTGEATKKLEDAETITVDGFKGKIYKGETKESVKAEIHPIDTEKQTKTKIKVIVDLPSYAERASKTGVKSIGLTRIEGIIAENEKHPKYYLNNNQMQEYEKIIYDGIKQISEYFEEIWVRSSDIRSDEFGNLEGAPKEKEANPMLGMHGIRAGLKNKAILKSELNALKKVAGEKNKRIGLLLSQVISVKEVKKTKQILEEIGFENAKIGVMIETPASVAIIKELCEEKIDFISFGTNDLTQYTLAVDRGNEQVQYLFNELHPAILHQLKDVINICKDYEVETSICGQAGSKKEMVKFLVEKGIDSISVNADKAKEIQNYIYELEKNLPKENKEEEIKQELEEAAEEAEENKKQETENKEEEQDNNFDVFKPQQKQENIKNADKQDSQEQQTSNEQQKQQIVKKIKQAIQQAQENQKQGKKGEAVVISPQQTQTQQPQQSQESQQTQQNQLQPQQNQQQQTQTSEQQPEQQISLEEQARKMHQAYYKAEQEDDLDKDKIDESEESEKEDEKELEKLEKHQEQQTVDNQTEDNQEEQQKQIAEKIKQAIQQAQQQTQTPEQQAQQQTQTPEQQPQMFEQKMPPEKQAQKLEQAYFQEQQEDDLDKDKIDEPKENKDKESEQENKEKVKEDEKELEKLEKNQEQKSKTNLTEESENKESKTNQTQEQTENNQEVEKQEEENEETLDIF